MAQCDHPDMDIENPFICMSVFKRTYLHKQMKHKYNVEIKYSINILYGNIQLYLVCWIQINSVILENYAQCREWKRGVLGYNSLFCAAIDTQNQGLQARAIGGCIWHHKILLRRFVFRCANNLKLLNWPYIFYFLNIVQKK